jgi:predicted ester cyclase
MSPEDAKRLVRRLVDAVNRRDPELLGEIASGDFVETAERWTQPFRSAFPDFRMEIVSLIAEGETVVGHFRCSGTHEGEWLGLAPTGRKFRDIDEIYIFTIRTGRVASATGLEDNLRRLRQLGMRIAAPDEPLLAAS